MDGVGSPYPYGKIIVSEVISYGILASVGLFTKVVFGNNASFHYTSVDIENISINTNQT